MEKLWQILCNSIRMDQMNAYFCLHEAGDSPKLQTYAYVVHKAPKVNLVNLHLIARDNFFYNLRKAVLCRMGMWL